jgi:hypothetical protein
MQVLQPATCTMMCKAALTCLLCIQWCNISVNAAHKYMCAFHDYGIVWYYYCFAFVTQSLWWSGLWHCVVLWAHVNISEEHAASNFRAETCVWFRTSIDYAGRLQETCSWDPRGRAG